MLCALRHVLRFGIRTSFVNESCPYTLVYARKWFFVIRDTLFASKRTLFPPIFLDTYFSLLNWKKLCQRQLAGIIDLFYKTSFVIKKSGTVFELFHKNCVITMKLKVSQDYVVWFGTSFVLWNSYKLRELRLSGTIGLCYEIS